MSEKEEIKINEPKEDNNKETQIAEEKPDIKNELTKKLDIEIPKEKEKSYIKFLDNKLDKLFYDIKYYSLSVIQVDIYGNSIPLGAFCFAIAFILIGFKDCKVNKDIDEFFYYIILFFGCFGQLIAGILEYIKGRTLPANLYLLYGVYFLSYFYFYHSDSNENLLSGLKAFYYGSWAVLSFPIFIGSVQSNVFFLVQTLVAFAFFVLRCIGEHKKKNKINETVSGILELVTGFVSLYIGINQTINSNFKFRVMPSLPLSQYNDIDIINKENDKENEE